MRVESPERKRPLKEELLRMFPAGATTMLQDLVSGMTTEKIAEHLTSTRGREKGPRGVQHMKDTINARFSATGESAGIYRAIFLLARENLITVKIDRSRFEHKENQPTEMELTVAVLAAEGYSDKEIEKQLGTDHRKASRQKTSLCNKLGTKGNFYAVAAWLGMEAKGG